jgi:hypothetical protein
MRSRNLLRGLEQYLTLVYGPDFTYDEGLLEVWRRLRQAYPDARLVVFTTPESRPLFSLMVRMGHFPDYERWLADLVGAFGEVWDFTGLNSVTEDQTNYLDAHHFTPEIGRLIVDRLAGRPLPFEHVDFGVQVTRASLRQHLDRLRGRLPGVDPDPVRTARERLKASEAVRPG